MDTPTRTNPNTAQPDMTRTYEQLLATAQAAQSAADRAVGELVAVKRTMAEAPRVLQQRQDEVARAQHALEQAERDAAQAGKLVSLKQTEAARLIEAAADAQKALAQALIAQDVIPQAAADVLAAHPAAALKTYQQQSNVSYAATLGTNRYTPMPALHPADLHAEVVEHLTDRDALCPSCGHSLRGVKAARCPGCKMQLSLSILHSVRAHVMTAPRSIWLVRFAAFAALVLSFYLTFVVMTSGKPFGCGGGSDCEFVLRSPWARLLGIPVALMAVPLYICVLVSSLFLRVGLKDSTRKKAWSILTFAAIASGLAGLWFLFVQVAILKALCPHCIIVDLSSILIALIVFKKAPLGRFENLPEAALGRIMVERKTAGAVMIAALATVSMFAGLHFLTNNSKGPLNKNVILGIPEKPAEPDDSGKLLMKGLDISKDPPKEERDKPPATTDIAPVAPPSAPEFILDPPTAPATKSPEVKDQPTPAAPKGLLLPGLDLGPTKQDEKKDNESK